MTRSCRSGSAEVAQREPPRRAATPRCVRLTAGTLMMRISICFRRGSRIHRLVWLNESTAGIYLGVLGGQREFHVSYHQDGTRHAKFDSEYQNRFSDVPIAAHTGVKQLEHLSLSMTKEWFSAATLYRGDEKTETLVLLDEGLFQGRDTCSLDVWLLDRAAEPELFAVVGRLLAANKAFQVVAEMVAALDHFPNHKIALTLRTARIRGSVA